MINVATWNVNRNNILNKNKLMPFKGLDIIFLQEVNKKSLDFLISNSQDFTIFFAKEILKTFSIEREYFLVTLISNQSNIKIKNKISNTITTFQPLIYKIINRKIHIEYITIEAKIKEKNINLTNCHLQFACPPSVRIKQFKEIISNNNKKMIIGGDLNIFIRPPISFLFSPFMNIKLSELFKNEKEFFFREFNEFKYLSNRETTIYRSGRIDYILASSDISLASEKILKNRMNSDHFPVISTLNL